MDREKELVSEYMTPLPPSPCVGICALKGDNCYGCGRTSDEIAAWGSLSPAGQSAVWAELPGRLAAFGFRTFRLAAGPAVVGAFIGRTFAETTGRWRLVSASIEAGFAITDDARPVVRESESDVRATLPEGDRLRLRKHERVRIFGFSSSSEGGQMDTVALVLPKGRAQRDLGEAGIDRGDMITDLALPEPCAEAGLINANPDIGALGSLSWGDVRQFVGDHTQAGGRVMVRNALGSIEASAVVLADEAPVAEANAPGDVKISKAFIACAIFHCDDPDWLAKALAP